MADKDRRISQLVLLFTVVAAGSAATTIAIGVPTAITIATVVAAVAAALALFPARQTTSWEPVVISSILVAVAVGVGVGARAQQAGSGDDAAQQRPEEEPVTSATTTSSTTSTTITSTTVNSSTTSSTTTTTTTATEGYTAEWRSEMMDTCSSGDLGNFLDRCTCMVDWIADNVPYEDFKAYDEALQQDPNTPEPAWWAEMRRVCLPTPF